MNVSFEVLKNEVRVWHKDRAEFRAITNTGERWIIFKNDIMLCYGLDRKEAMEMLGELAAKFYAKE